MNNSWLLVSYHIKDFGVKGLSELSIPEAKFSKFIDEKRSVPGVKGFFYIQTCNRIEYLYSLKEGFNIDQNLCSLVPKLSSRLYTKTDDIIQHLLSVCLSKDSLVFGENQILGQFKRSYQDCLDKKILSKDLGYVIRLVIQEAKKIRSKMSFKHFPNSMSSIVAQKIHQTLGKSSSILFIGAGETNEMVAKYLLKKSYNNFYWLNRSEEKAKRLANLIGGKALSWKQAFEGNEFDLVVTATNAGEILVNGPLLDQWNVKHAMDLSVPANIDKDACEKHGVSFLSVEDFNKNLEQANLNTNSFLSDLNKEIFNSQQYIFSEFKLFDASKLIQNLKHEHEQILKDTILSANTDLNFLSGEDKDKALLMIQKNLKEAFHKQVLNLRTQIASNENH